MQTGNAAFCPQKQISACSAAALAPTALSNGVSAPPGTAGRRTQRGESRPKLVLAVDAEALFTPPKLPWPTPAVRGLIATCVPPGQLPGHGHDTPQPAAAGLLELPATPGADAAPLEPRQALHLVKKLLRYNLHLQAADAVEVILVCHADEVPPQRLLDSLRRENVWLERQIYVHRTPAHVLLQPLQVTLYLTAQPQRAAAALACGMAAASLQVNAPLCGVQVGADSRLCVVLDFDGVVAGRSAQAIYDAQGLQSFGSHEDSLRDTPLEPGPLLPFAQGLVRLQQAVAAHAATREMQSLPGVDLCVVTARGGRGVARMLRTLQAWGLATHNELVCLGGSAKTRFVAALQADLFLDDQVKHLISIEAQTVAGHVPSELQEIKLLETILHVGNRDGDPP
jgi:5'-nucleotidase